MCEAMPGTEMEDSREALRPFPTTTCMHPVHAVTGFCTPSDRAYACLHTMRLYFLLDEQRLLQHDLS